MRVHSTEPFDPVNNPFPVFRVMRLDQLIKALGVFPGDALACCQTIGNTGNIVVYESPDGPMLGFVDLGEEVAVEYEQ